MRTLAAIGALAVAVALGIPGSSEAQEPSGFLSVGQEAPDIQVAGATRYGVLSEPVRLSQFRGETVVLAFFFRARSGG
jgi:peroxiredoxin Q/BCP